MKQAKEKAWLSQSLSGLWQGFVAGFLGLQFFSAHMVLVLKGSCLRTKGCITLAFQGVNVSRAVRIMVLSHTVRVREAATSEGARCAHRTKNKGLSYWSWIFQCWKRGRCKSWLLLCHSPFGILFPIPVWLLLLIFQVSAKISLPRAEYGEIHL